MRTIALGLYFVLAALALSQQKPGVQLGGSNAGSPWAKDECPPEPLIDGTSEGLRLGYRIDGGDGDATEADLGRVASDAPDAAGAGSGIRLRRRI